MLKAYHSNQVSDIKTGFFYEEVHEESEYNHYRDDYDIIIKSRLGVLALLDWSTMSFSEEKMEMVDYEKQFPACAIIQGENQETNIALTRGLKAKGMDFIKVGTSNREEATSQLPMESPGEGLGFSQMVTVSFINNGYCLLHLLLFQVFLKQV